jgi:hypothetical protein
MLPSRFDTLRERLLRAGIAPRHVRRYISELRDHFDDLVREEIAGGATRQVAEAKARTRLGSDDDLAQTMLVRPGLRSVSARFPWAVFCLGPVAFVIVALVGAVFVELGSFRVAHALIPHPQTAQREAFVSAIAIWNTLATYVAPLLIAAMLTIIGLRQRMSAAWIFAGIAIACFLGAFQEIHWKDNGVHGELSLGTGFLPPFPAHLVVGGLFRAIITFALAAAIYSLGIRRQNSDASGERAMVAGE